MTDCQDLCANHATCKSVDYHPGTKICNFNNANASTVTLTSPCGGSAYSEPVKGKLLYNPNRWQTCPKNPKMY